MSGKVVIGLGFGDEGKGLATSFLCSRTENPLVVRFSSGHNAGHTVVHKGQRHVFSSFGSGTLQGVPTYWSKDCTFYPIAFLNELNILKELGIEPRIFLNPLCPVTTPYDVFNNRVIAPITKHGSVGVGFGSTIKRNEDNYRLFVQDLYYEKIFIEKLSNISKYYGYEKVISSQEIDYFVKMSLGIRKYIILQNDIIINHYSPIFEGSQGILLDQTFGFFPNVTRANTTSKNAFELYPDITEVYYVTRTYQTRHGNGFMTNEVEPLKLVNNEKETNIENYQGKFRTSPLDIELLNYAIDCDLNFSKQVKHNLIITCYDQLPIDIDNLLWRLNPVISDVYISKGDSLDTIIKHKQL